MGSSTINGDSNSTYDSNLSDTVVDPNSTKNTPNIPQIPQYQSYSTGKTNKPYVTGNEGVGDNLDNSCAQDDKDVAENLDNPYAPDDEDVEENLDKPVPGWPRVAKLMAETPDFAAFSRFRDLNIKNLLYYQAELTDLRRRLHQQEWEDYRDGDEKERKYAKRADLLMSSGEKMNPEEKVNLEEMNPEEKMSSGEKNIPEQYKLVIEIRRVLKEYNEALLQYSQISVLPEPHSLNMKSFRIWLRDRKGGHYSIGGNGEENTWGDLYGKEKDDGSIWEQFLNLLWSFWYQPPPSDDLDLVAPRPPRKVDGFTRWVAGELIPFYVKYKEHREDRKKKKKKNADLEKAVGSCSILALSSGSRRKKEPQRKKLEDPKHKKPFQQKTVETYPEKAILKFTSSVTTVVACLLPTIAIVVLSQVQEMKNLLLCLSGFVVIFSVGLILLTSGTTTRVDIFTATAAFSAVLVVFISVPVVVVQ